MSAPSRPWTRVPAKPRVGHQFHAGSTFGKAISIAMLMIRTQLPAPEVVRTNRVHALSGNKGASRAPRVALCTGTCVAVSPLSVFEDANYAVYRLSGLTAFDNANGLERLSALSRFTRAHEQYRRTMDTRAALGCGGAKEIGMLRRLFASVKGI